MSVLSHIFSQFIDLDIPNKEENREYMQLIKEYSDMEDALIQQLTGEQKQQFLHTEAKRNALAALEDERMFCYGFRIGVQVILETLYTRR